MTEDRKTEGRVFTHNFVLCVRQTQKNESTIGKQTERWRLMCPMDMVGGGSRSVFHIVKDALDKAYMCLLDYCCFLDDSVSSI